MALSRREQLLAQLRNNLAIATKAVGFDSPVPAKKDLRQDSRQDVLQPAQGVTPGTLSDRHGSSLQASSVGSNPADKDFYISKVLKTIPGVEEGVITGLLTQKDSLTDSKRTADLSRASKINLKIVGELDENGEMDGQGGNSINIDAAASRGMGGLEHSGVAVEPPKPQIRKLSPEERSQLVSAMDEMHANISALQDALSSLADMKKSLLERPASSQVDSLILENGRMQEDLQKQLWSVNHAATEIAKKLADDKVEPPPRAPQDELIFAQRVGSAAQPVVSNDIRLVGPDSRYQRLDGPSPLGPHDVPSSMDGFYGGQLRSQMPALKVVNEPLTSLPNASANSLAYDSRPQYRSLFPITDSNYCKVQQSSSPRRNYERSRSREKDYDRRDARRRSYSRSPSGKKRRSRSRSGERRRRRSESRDRDRKKRSRRSGSDEDRRSRRRRSRSKDKSNSRKDKKDNEKADEVIPTKPDDQKRPVYLDLSDDFPSEKELSNLPAKLEKKEEVKPAVIDKVEQELAVKLAMSAYLRADKYYDGGEEWCKVCDVVVPDIISLCHHLLSDQHSKKINPELDTVRPPLVKPPTGSNKVAPARGYEFLVAKSTYFCSICNESLKDEAAAEKHVIGILHNNKFKLYLKKNPNYEADYLQSKMAAATRQPTAAKSSAANGDKFQLKITGSLKTAAKRVLPGIDPLNTDSESDTDTSSPNAHKKTTANSQAKTADEQKSGSRFTNNPNKNINSKQNLGWQISAVAAQQKKEAEKSATTAAQRNTKTDNNDNKKGSKVEDKSKKQSIDMFDPSPANIKLPTQSKSLAGVKITTVDVSDFVAVDEC